MCIFAAANPLAMNASASYSGTAYSLANRETGSAKKQAFSPSFVHKIGYCKSWQITETHICYAISPFFTFTGKERDAETGYNYHGARYYDAGLLTGWLSVDPLADKYPGISPYNYCAWNPVKLVDPDGKEMWKPEVLADGSVNYVKESGDTEKTLQGQYGLDKKLAHNLYGSMKNGRISGRSVRKATGSDILKYNTHYRNPHKFLRTSSKDIQQKVYHVGFAALYSHVNGGGTFKLNDFFTGLGEDYSGITSRDGWGNRPPISIPKLGGGDIPINDLSCQAGSSSFLTQNGELKQNITLGNIRTGERENNGCALQYFQKGASNNGMPGFTITFSRGSNGEIENEINRSYRH